MRGARTWSEMTVDEKLEALRRDLQLHQGQSAAMGKAMNELRRRLEQIEQRFDESMLD
jgi:hypothetical protein